MSGKTCQGKKKWDNRAGGLGLLASWTGNHEGRSEASESRIAGMGHLGGEKTLENGEQSVVSGRNLARDRKVKNCRDADWSPFCGCKGRFSCLACVWTDAEVPYRGGGVLARARSTATTVDDVTDEVDCKTGWLHWRGC